MLSVSAWIWIGGAALGVLSIAFLIRVTLVLLKRLKDLTRTLSSASSEVQGALGSMREELDQASEHLSAIRERRDELG